MALESGGLAAAKRPRPPPEDGETGQHDRLSALPEPLQLRILTFLPLRSAILASSLSRSWRGLWVRRWEDDGNPSSSLHHHLRPYSTPCCNKLLEILELRQSKKSRNVLICHKVFSGWIETRVCSELATLTICSNVLFVVSSLLNATSHAESTKMVGDLFPRMTELQLIMLEMTAPEFANIYMFLKNSGCSNLERPFVQLPTAPSGLFVDSFDYVELEPPPDVLKNLKVVKITNFSWNCFELQLVSFLLRNASSLRKLLLITPSLVPLHVPGIQQADLFFIAEAVANCKVILSGSDDAATQPFHSDVSADF